MKHRPDASWTALACAAAWLVLLPTARGQDPSVIWEKHAWARFGVGSWKQVRVHNESLNDKGQVESTSITDTRTTLIGVTDVDYSIQIDVVVEVAGRRFNAEPKVLRQGFHGETNGQSVELQTIGPAQYAIDGQKYPVEVRKLVINGDELKRVSLVHYSDQVVPNVLKRETKATSTVGGRPHYESLVEVVAVELPFRVLSETKLVSHLKTVHRRADGATSISLEVHCQDVPGGVVASSSKELNAAGRIAARSTLELKEYQVVPVSAEPVEAQSDRRRLFHRTRARKGA